MHRDSQIVDINKDNVPCRNCGANLVDVVNFVYMGEVDTRSTFIEEHCQCKHCKSIFILHYDLFDIDGHIYSKVFTEDVNNPDNNWQDNLTEEQKKIISQHLRGCKICIDRLNQEILTDAWLKSFIQALKEENKQV